MVADRGWPFINLIYPNQSFYVGIIKFFAFMTHIDLEKYLERFFRFKKKLVKANIFIPWVELVQSSRCGDNG